MSITNYSELIAAAAHWSHRDDLAAYMSDYVTLAEARLYRGDDGQFATKPLRLRSMQAQDTGEVTVGSIAFPDSYLETINLRVASGGSTTPLRYVSPQNYAERVSSDGIPQFYTILNNAIKVAGTGSAGYTHDYYSSFTPLTATEPTNALLTSSPNVYLWAICLEIATDSMDDAKAQRFYGRLVGAINGLQNSDKNIYAGGSLAVMIGR